MFRRVLGPILLSLALLVIASCGAGSEADVGGSPTSSFDASTTTSATDASAPFVETFHLVWTTVNEGFYDPQFRGLDWDAMYDEYLPLVKDATSPEELTIVINSMLFELDVSHLAYLPPGEHEQIDSILTAEGALGLDVRKAEGVWVVTSVDGPAAEAGLRAGLVLESVGGMTVEEIADEAPPVPPSHERGVRSNQTNAVRAHLFGPVGSSTSLGYLDIDGIYQEVTLAYRERGQPSEIMPGLPPAYVELEVSRLDVGVGYIRFNAFVPGLLKPISDAIDSMADAPGLIIDLRGNHGGVFPVRKGLIDRLVDDSVLVWKYVGRDQTNEIYVDPATKTYDGPLVVLVDVLSASSAEEFAGALQAIGRATVIGEHTAGRVLTANFNELPDGSLVAYPFAETRVADGTVLEGRGVIPDVAVAIRRDDLLAGIDPVLEAGIEHLLSPATP